jgi:TRAP-type C4-dicarboxylate transport system permease small subunit
MNAVPPDAFGRLVDRADRLWRPVENAMNLIGGLIVFALMFVGMLQILLRTVFRSPMIGYIDIVELSMIGFAILGISYVQREGGHVRMDMVLGYLRGRWLWAVETFGVLVAMVLVGVLIPYSYGHFLRAYTFGDSTIDIELPNWPAKLVVPIALGVLFVRLAIQLLGYLRQFANPAAVPVGVPVLKSVSEQADDEIEGAQE